MVKTCCFCFPLKSGVLIIGTLNVVLFVIELLFIIYSAATPDEAGDMFQKVDYIVLVLLVFHLVFSVLILIAVLKEIRLLLLPWPIWTICASLVFISLGIYLVFYDGDASVLILGLVVCPEYLYFAYVVWAYYRETGQEPPE